MGGQEERIERLNPAKPLPIITYGLPYYEACARHLASTLRSTRAYVIISGSLSRETDALERLTESIGKDRIAGVRKGMQSHTLYSEVLEIVAELKATGADAILTVGGGSLVDGAKAAALALANDADTVEKLDEVLLASGALSKALKDGDDAAVKELSTRARPSTIPYMCATTTLSAGEYNPFGGATNDVTRHKQLFADPSPEAGHRVIAVDPRLTLTTPERVWLSTGMRAVDHCVEAVCSSAPSAEGTAHALRGLSLLIPSLLRSKKDAGDLEARLNAQLGAAESMKASVLYGVPLGASHGIGHQLGPCGVPHAETTCVLLPAVLKYNAKANAEQQAVILKVFWKDPAIAAVLAAHSLSPETADLGDAIDAVIRELGLPRTLKTYGIGRDRLGAIAESSLKDRLCRVNAVPLVEKEQVLEILETCLGDDA